MLEGGNSGKGTATFSHTTTASAFEIPIIYYSMNSGWAHGTIVLKWVSNIDETLAFAETYEVKFE